MLVKHIKSHFIIRQWYTASNKQLIYLIITNPTSTHFIKFT